MSRPLGNDEGFKRVEAAVRLTCPCGRGIPTGQRYYLRAEEAFRCIHCQLRARSATMTDAECGEMLSRIFEACNELPQRPQLEKVAK
jgi:hypothetical protein